MCLDCSILFNTVLCFILARNEFFKFITNQTGLDRNCVEFHAHRTKDALFTMTHAIERIKTLDFRNLSVATSVRRNFMRQSLPANKYYHKELHLMQGSCIYLCLGVLLELVVALYGVTKRTINVMFYRIWYNLHTLKNMRNSNGGALLLVTLIHK